MNPPGPASWSANPLFEWWARRPLWVLVLAVLLILGPFLGKPFNMDDPLFLSAARHIQTHPLDPYGFDVNWYGSPQPMSVVTKNPPLACYYLALIGAFFGWSEPAVHAGFLLPALAAVIGSYRLARHFCRRPLLAAAIAWFTPVFVISGTTVMCDVLMLAFWMWAMVFWIEGTARADQRRLAAASLLITGAALTKYFGVCLLPLLVLWSILKRQRISSGLFWLCLPVAAIAIYQIVTIRLYGRGLLSDAGAYAVQNHSLFDLSRLTSGVVALAFTGGSLATAVFFAPLLWRERVLVPAAIVMLLAGVSFAANGWIIRDVPLEPGPARNFLAMQVAFWAVGGAGILALCLVDLWRRLDADAWMLAAWIWGTFLFAAVFNWTVNGRSLLPMAVPVGILVARRLDERRATRTINRMAVAIPLAAGVVFAYLAARADFLLAKGVRDVARQVQEACRPSGRPLWFQGHWGFQYYMELGGAQALDVIHPKIKRGDLLAIPRANTNVYPLEGSGNLTRLFDVPWSGWLATYCPASGAGFYSSALGPLPVAFGRIPGDVVGVFVMDRPFPAVSEQ